MPSSAQNPGEPGSTRPASQPNAPPMISSGATTPPEVPDERATSQITAFTRRIASTARSIMCPASRSRMTP